MDITNIVEMVILMVAPRPLLTELGIYKNWESCKYDQMRGFKLLLQPKCISGYVKSP